MPQATAPMLPQGRDDARVDDADVERLGGGEVERERVVRVELGAEAAGVLHAEEPGVQVEHAQARGLRRRLPVRRSATRAAAADAKPHSPFVPRLLGISRPGEEDRRGSRIEDQPRLS